MKIRIAMDRKEVLAAIGQYLIDHGVPLVAGTFHIRVKYEHRVEWVDLCEKDEIGALVEYEAESMGSERGVVDKP